MGGIVIKKIIFEIIKILIAYIIIAVYGYYNTPEPDNRYSWLTSAIIVITLYFILIFIEKRKKRKNK